MASRIPGGRRRRTTRFAGTALPLETVPQTAQMDGIHTNFTLTDIVVMDDHEPPRPCKVVMSFRIDPWTRMVHDWDYDLIRLDSCEGPDHVA